MGVSGHHHALAYLCSGKMPVSNAQEAVCASELALQFRKQKNLPLQGFKPQIIQCTA